MAKEIIDQEEFEILVQDEMLNDRDAGGNPVTSRAYAERWVRSEYEVR